jgi:hypothetical protein
MSESLQLFCALMVLCSPFFVIAFAALIIRPILMWLHGKVLAQRRAVTFGLDESWFKVDPQKLREWREMNRGKK